MRAFEFQRAGNAAEALKAEGRFLAGGTTLVDLMRLEVETPTKLVDVKRLPFNKVETKGADIRIGASITNSALAKHPLITENLPALSQAILAGASPQLRNLATTAGNLLQRTRCSYFRDITQACNKRAPGSGCSAWDGYNRMHAILGGSEHCIAAHPSDMCVAMAAFGARVVTQGAKNQSREIPFEHFYVKPGEHPAQENTLQPGELITHVLIPKTPFFKKSLYLKARDRASYAFALASVAVALDLEGGKIREARVAFGGVATIPWRSPEAEAALKGRKLDPVTALKAADAAFANTHSREHNAFKGPLAKRLLIQALRDLGGAK